MFSRHVTKIKIRNSIWQGQKGQRHRTNLYPTASSYGQATRVKRARYIWTTKTHLKQKRNPMGTEAEPTWLLAQPKRMPLLLLLLLYVCAGAPSDCLPTREPLTTFASIPVWSYSYSWDFFRKQHGCLNKIEWQNVPKRMWVVRDIWASCTWDELRDAKDLNNLPMCKSFSRAKLMPSCKKQRATT